MYYISFLLFSFFSMRHFVIKVTQPSSQDTSSRHKSALRWNFGQLWEILSSSNYYYLTFIEMCMLNLFCPVIILKKCLVKKFDYFILLAQACANSKFEKFHELRYQLFIYFRLIATIVAKTMWKLVLFTRKNLFGHYTWCHCKPPNPSPSPFSLNVASHY